MSFYGCHFSFDGVPCTEYGLMLYDFGASSSEGGALLSGIDIIEDRIARKYKPIQYGTVMNKPLEFTMTFGADIDAIDRDVHLDRWDLDAITNWLTGHNTYKWLEITQPDMETVRYKCFITNLRYVEYGKIPWGISCTVLCDSPFAYMYPESYQYTINGYGTFTFYNKSSFRGYYKPILILSPQRGGSFSIQNDSDGGYLTEFSGLPTSVTNIVMDCENEIITCNGISNPYPYFNFHFFRLVRGNNTIVVNGIGTLQILCEFPVSVGG